MDSAVAGLLGVGLGSVGTLIAARMSNRTAERLSRMAVRDQRVQMTREKAAEAYVAALEAVQWLSTHHVEDSVNSRFKEEYQPRTESALTRLREARRAASYIAASGVAGRLPALALETEVALSVLDDSWHAVQEYAEKIQSVPKENAFYKTFKGLFDSNWERLLASRMSLTGFDGTETTRDEIDQGTALPGSLLHELRNTSLELD